MQLVTLPVRYPQLPLFEPTSSFNVSWSGSDTSNGSAISGFTIYVSDNGGPFTPWLENTTLTTAEFQGQVGHSYDFFSIAIDNAGNVQAPPGLAQASTTVGPAAPIITSADHSSFTVGAANSFSLTAIGFPTPTLSETGALPDGLFFDPTTGILNGTPSAGTGGSYSFTFNASNGVSPHATQQFTLVVNQAIAVQNVQINDGSIQRSEITSITVSFSRSVGKVDDGAFQIVAQQGGGNPAVVVSWNASRTSATLTLTGSLIIGGSLQDGNFSLVMDSTKIHDPSGGLLDGDGDGLSGGARPAEAFFPAVRR